MSRLDINSPSPTQEFGKIRTIFWPVHTHELKKILPMFVLFFLISFVYHLLRCMKITIMVKTSGIGAEALPFLKLWVILPSAVIFTYLYTVLCSKFNRVQVFNYIILIFIAYFAVFLFFIYPNRDALTLTYIPNILTTILPSGCSGLISIIRHFHLTSFYVFAEMWSIIVLSILFWGFSNEVTKMNEAKRFYALIALGANFAGIFSGQATIFLTATVFNPSLKYGLTSWDQTVFMLLATVIVFCFLMILLFNWLDKKIAIYNANNDYINLANNTHENNTQANNTKLIDKEKPEKISLYESIIYLMKSKYAGCLAIIVVSYNVVYNIADVLWTDQLNHRFEDPNSLNLYLARLDSITGVVSVILAIFVFSNCMRKFGWTITALISPMIWLVASITLFAGLLMENTNSAYLISYLFVNLPFNDIIIMLGTIQMCLGRASKYTIFDQSKEIAFIPLSTTNKRKSKAVIDGIGSRFGKSGSAIFFQVLLICCGGSLARTMPYAATLMLIMLFVWIFGCVKLGTKIAALSKDKRIFDTLDSDDYVEPQIKPETQNSNVVAGNATKTIFST